MRTRARPNACEVSSAKIIKGSNEANSFPLPPRRKVKSKEDTRDSLWGELGKLFRVLDGGLEVNRRELVVTQTRDRDDESKEWYHQ